MFRDRRTGVAAWCLFDWANSAFPTVIITFVFAAYFTEAVAADRVTGTSQWGYTMSLSALAVALAGPLLGAVADHSGRRKPWLAAFTALAVGATAMLWYARPGVDWALWTLLFVALANFGFEMGMVFYNAMLPELAPKDRIGRVSGWGWGLGYAGGLASLAVALVFLVQADPPPFGLDKGTAEHVRATALLVAGWFAVFSLPLFLFTPDAGPSGLAPAEALRRGVGTLIATIKNLRQHGVIAHFLLARMIYTDGLNTLFAFAGIYAAGTFGMKLDEVILLGIAINATAGLGAVLFAWVDDWIGPKRTILISLVALTVLGAAVLVAQTKTQFWVFAVMLGVFVGPAQAASRSMMARLAPEHLRGEMFGLYAFSGKATAFVGPALLAWVTAYAGSQRAGMATILVFFAAGMALLWPLPEPGR